MKVRATKAGFLDYFREVGAEFEFQDESFFSDEWMEVIDGSEPKKKAKPSKAKSDDSGSSSSGDSEVI